ncbi:MAG: DUF4197 domain-containing protein [Saprospirales bacterium]|nr:MAG: DUF4197 domain-containing protein [Saprospirales bacterium]
MKHFLTILILGILISFTSCAELQQILEQATTDRPVTTEEVALGLKEALNQGVVEGVGFLHARDGFLRTQYQIPLPEEVQVITSRVKRLPLFSDVEDVLIERINRAAEDAVGRATPIFGDAIRAMSISDAWDILRGERNEATLYLYSNTHGRLYDEFNPVILDALNKFEVLDYYESVINAYNSIPLIEKRNPRIDDFVTSWALDALFDRVAIEEEAIRTNVERRTSDLLQRVFARQDSPS